MMLLLNSTVQEGSPLSTLDISRTSFLRRLFTLPPVQKFSPDNVRPSISRSKKQNTAYFTVHKGSMGKSITFIRQQINEKGEAVSAEEPQVLQQENSCVAADYLGLTFPWSSIRKRYSCNSCITHSPKSSPTSPFP